MKNNQYYPLTNEQHSVVIQQLKSPDVPISNMIGQIKITGSVDIDRFIKAHQLTVEYHDIFSMQLSQDEAGRYQAEDVADVSLPMVLVNCEQQASTIFVEPQEVEAWIEQFIRQPITQLNQPLHQASLIQMSPDQYEFWFILSHVVADGYAIAIFLKHLYDIYDALGADDPKAQLLSCQQAVIPFQLAMSDDQKYSASAKYQSDKAFWIERLTDLPTQPVVARYNFQHSSEEVVRSQAVYKTISVEQFNQIKALADGAKVHVNIVLQALIYIYVVNCYGVDEMVIGRVTHNRRHFKARNTLGMFSKILPGRLNYGRELTLAQLIQLIHKQTREESKHGAFPIDHLADSVDLYHHGRSQLFDVVFNFLNLSLDIHPQGLRTKSRWVHLGYDPYPLNVTFVEFGEHQDLELNVEYNLSYFNEGEAQLISQRLIQLLESMADNMDKKVSDFDVLVEQDWHLIRAYNDTSKPYPMDKGIHQLFLTQANRTPDACALVDIDGSLSYLQVAELVVALSGRLPALTASQRKPIGVYLDKGRGQLVATLAIMCQGDFYVPLETHWPAQRVEKVIAKAGIETVVSCEALSSVLPQGVQQILIDDLAGAAITESWQQQVADSCNPDSLAYVIFTSGSTGEPKGVSIAHKACANTLYDINERMKVTPDDRILAVSDLSFDLNVYDFFGMLAAGGTIIFTHHELARDPAHWAQMIDQHGVTLWNTVPASADLLVSYLELNDQISNAPIRHMILSGDWLPPSLPARLEQRFTASGQPAKVHSFGGATEASIWSITYPIEQDCSQWKSIPYGRPLHNQSFYVLNQQQVPQPVGVEGELYIGGVGVAENYFNDEEKTRHSYIFHPQLQQRLYRTGDLGRLMVEGNIEFIGRVDHQVKINGFRIELGEIESHLKQLDQLADVTCHVVESEQGNKILNAYLVKADAEQTDEQLEYLCQEYLMARVPVYMMPANYIFLDSIPLTSNGKIDRKSLPVKVTGDDLQPPSSEIEKAIASIWMAELQLNRVGVKQSFFELGGTSYNAIRILMQLNLEFDSLDLQLKDVMRSYSIYALAVQIEQRLAEQSHEQVVEGEVEELEW